MINKENLDFLKNFFIHHFDGFKNFESPGELYTDNEYNYKLDAHSFIHEIWDNWILNNELKDDETFIKEFKVIVKKTNLLNWRDLEVILEFFGNNNKILKILIRHR